MDSKTLSRDLSRVAGGSLLINKSQLRAALGCGNNPNSLANVITQDLDYVWTGKAKNYYIQDVAAALVKHFREVEYER